MQKLEMPDGREKYCRVFWRMAKISLLLVTTHEGKTALTPARDSSMMRVRLLNWLTTHRAQINHVVSNLLESWYEAEGMPK